MVYICFIKSNYQACHCSLMAVSLDKIKNERVNSYKKSTYSSAPTKPISSIQVYYHIPIIHYINPLFYFFFSLVIYIHYFYVHKRPERRQCTAFEYFLLCVDHLYTHHSTGHSRWHSYTQPYDLYTRQTPPIRNGCIVYCA